MNTMTSEWENIRRIESCLRREFGEAPRIAIVLGSGLKDVAKQMTSRVTVSSSQVEGWPTSTVAGHAGALHVGEVRGKRAFIIEGRVHLYEGYTPNHVVRPIRAAIAWGVEILVLTNAAGAVSEAFTPGDIMVLKDHINLTGKSPLVGPSDDIPEPRFPDLSDLYSKELFGRVVESADETGISLQQGVYAGVLGPSYETAAEVRMLEALGAHAVGMSTVLEAIAAIHMGAKVVGLSTLTNMATGRKGAILDHEHVQKVGGAAASSLGRLIEAFIEKEA